MLQRILLRMWGGIARPFHLDLRSLALFRGCLAGLVLIDLANRGFWLRAHYTDFGVLPRAALLETRWDPAWVSAHMLSGAAELQVLLFVLAGIVAVLLLVGWRTRLMTILSWFLLVSVQARNPVVLQGGDVVLRLLLFWGMFLPLGARWSVDAALGQSTDSESASGHFSVASFAYIIQLCSIYYFSALLKKGGAWLESYDAVYYALALDQFTTPFGDWLFQQPVFHAPLTIGTLGLEAFGWMLVLLPVFTTPLRLVAIVLFCGMHLGMAATMQLGLFSYIMCVAWLALLPGVVWEWLRQRVSATEEECRLEAPPGFSKKAADLAKTFLVLPALTVATDAERHTWYLEDGEQKHHGWSAWTALLARSPLFWLLSPLVANRIARNTARWVGRKAGRLSTLLNWCLSRRLLRSDLSVPHSVLAAGALISVLAWNIDTVTDDWSVPEPWRTVTTSVRLDQKWGMFAPFPLIHDGWYVIPGTLKNGDTVNLFFGGPPSLDPADKPKDVSNLYPNQRWRKYLMNLRRSEYSRQQPYFSQWLCRRWNTRHSGGERLTSIDIYFMRETTPPPGEESDVEKVHHLDHQCAGSRIRAVDGEKGWTR